MYFLRTLTLTLVPVILAACQPVGQKDDRTESARVFPKPDREISPVSGTEFSTEAARDEAGGHHPRRRADCASDGDQLRGCGVGRYAAQCSVLKAFPASGSMLTSGRRIGMPQESDEREASSDGRWAMRDLTAGADRHDPERGTVRPAPWTVHGALLSGSLS